jgi:murein L,D-transpeptidase YcbB/YkuD
MQRLRATLCVVFIALLAWPPSSAAPAVASPWFDPSGRPTAHAHDAVDLLRESASHGLEPRDYDTDALSAALARAERAAPSDAAATGPLDRQLQANLLRYLHDLHAGRIDSKRQSHAGYRLPARDDFDAEAVLAAALVAGRVRELARDAAPTLPQYQRLRETLARYRSLATDPAWLQPLPSLPLPLPLRQRGERGKVEPGQAYAGLPTLARRLLAWGDLAAAPAAPPALYDGPLVDAVRAFQRRHGLADDGVIGPATLAKLEVPPAARVRQLELALERLRWTPLLQRSRMVVINIPEFVLRAYEVRDGRIVVQHSMKVIVGKAMDTRTPLIDADLRFIEFSPYWNVPPSIARAELVPRLRRDPAYWTREGFEFVGPDGHVDTALSAGGLDAVLAGRLRIRQRPGPRNALGDIKFVFPNHENIYLHHTPAIGLFERQRRDFSHGCIRVEQPVELATFVLDGMPEWNDTRIRQAMGRGESATLRLDEPVRVLIAYGTALVKEGQMFFFDDLYGQDRVLDLALRRVSLQRQADRLVP